MFSLFGVNSLFSVDIMLLCGTRDKVGILGVNAPRPRIGTSQKRLESISSTDFFLSRGFRFL
jgi:hypothetical protein